MGNVIQMAWPFILMAGIFYFMIYKPQKRDQKKRADMLNSLRVGTRIVTIGGILGTITKVQDDKLRIKVADHVEIHIRRSAVGGVLTTAMEKAKTEAPKAVETAREEAQKAVEAAEEAPKAVEAAKEEARKAEAPAAVENKTDGQA